MANPTGKNARSKHPKRGLTDPIVSDKTKNREKAAVMRFAERPENWRDTDITNTDYWACRQEVTA